MLEAQILFFARLCEVRHSRCESVASQITGSYFIQGNNERAIRELMYDPNSRSHRKGYVSLQEAILCAGNKYLNPILRSRYVKLILNMFVKVGKNWSFLDHLCYSFVSKHNTVVKGISPL